MGSGGYSRGREGKMRARLSQALDFSNALFLQVGPSIKAIETLFFSLFRYLKLLHYKGH